MALNEQDRTGDHGGVPRVEVRDLSLAYDEVPVIQGANLSVAKQAVAAVLGPSGSGKTTLLRAVAGFLRPVGGSIWMSGRLVSDRTVSVPPERRQVGLVPQEGALFPHLDVAGNVGFGLPRRTRAQRRVADARVDELLELVDLAGSNRLRPDQLSGGMQQRVALARALARRPQTVLLDEPFSALDAALRRELRIQVRELLMATGAGVILVTHDEDEAFAMADDVYTMSARRPAHVSRWVGR